MKLEVTIASTRQKAVRHYSSHGVAETEDYIVASVTAEGERDLIAKHLRAIADSLSDAKTSFNPSMTFGPQS
jgi:predicted dinucleotide-utilizing enzyme